MLVMDQAETEIEREHRAAIERAIRFLDTVGIPCRRSGERVDSVLPGVWLDHGWLVYNVEDIRDPCDLYHEAGHLAVIPSLFRGSVPKAHDFDSLEEDSEWGRQIEAYLDATPFLRPDHSEDPVVRGLLQMGEAEAIAWSYAAMVAAGMDPKAHFLNPEAFNNDGEGIYQALSIGRYLGINGLQAGGMTTVKTFPTLTRWLQR